MSDDKSQRKPLQWNVDHRIENGNIIGEVNSATLDSGKKIISSKIIKKDKTGRERFLTFKSNEMESLKTILDDLRYQMQAEIGEQRDQYDRRRHHG